VSALLTRQESAIRTAVLCIAQYHIASTLSEQFMAAGYAVQLEKPGEGLFERIVRHSPGLVVFDGEADLETSLGIAHRLEHLWVHRIVAIARDAMDRLPPTWLDAFDDILPMPPRPAELQARLAVADRLYKLENKLRRSNNRVEEADRIIARVNRQMLQDQFAVAKIQTALLPSSLPAISEAEFAWTYRPRAEVAGDGLNVFRLDEAHVGFYVLDVSGSGTPAALLSVLLSRQISPFPVQSTLLKSLVREAPGYRLNPPSEVLNELNRTFPFDSERIQFFTMFYGILNIRTGNLRYAVAGHPLPVLTHAGMPPRYLIGGGYPIGFVDDAAYEEHQIDLCHGDRLFIFTDGLSEAHDEGGRQFGPFAMLQTLSDIGSCDLKDNVLKLFSAAEAWCGNDGFHDDVSLLAVGLR